MSTRKDYFFKQKVTEADLDEGFETGLIEDGLPFMRVGSVYANPLRAAGWHVGDGPDPTAAVGYVTRLARALCTRMTHPALCRVGEDALIEALRFLRRWETELEVVRVLGGNAGLATAITHLFDQDDAPPWRRST